MNIWLTITLILAAVVFGIDYLFRRKPWKNNSKGERVSLLVNMFSVGPYAFSSAVGILWGLTGGSPDSALGATLYDLTLTLGAFFFFVALAAVIASFILRLKGKHKASIWINVIALVYFVAVLAINYFAGKLL